MYLVGDKKVFEIQLQSAYFPVHLKCITINYKFMIKIVSDNGTKYELSECGIRTLTPKRETIALYSSFRSLQKSSFNSRTSSGLTMPSLKVFKGAPLES